MKILSNAFIAFLLLIKEIFAEGFLVGTEFPLRMTASGIVGWPQTTVSCTQTQIVDRQISKLFGVFDKNNNSNLKKTYNLIQPHWSISVRVDVYLLKAFDPTNTVEVWMDNQMKRQYKESSIANSGFNFCISASDQYFQFYSNITHAAFTFDLEFKSMITTSASTGGFALSELYVTLDTCFPGCLTCSGPAEDQCLTCITGSTQTGNKCLCNTGFAYQQTCYSSCPAGYRGENTKMICVMDECNPANCQTCGTNQCTQCKSGFYLLDKICVTSCPNYTTTVANVCQDTKPSNGVYLIKALHKNFLSESDVSGSGLVISGFEGDGKETISSSGALTGVCNKIYYIGGFMLAGKNAKIKKSFSGLPPHSQIRVGFTFIAIDDWHYENMTVRFDGQKAFDFYVNFDLTDQDYCGVVAFKDDVFNVDQKAIHQAPTLDFEIQSSVAGNSFVASYGMRNLFLILEKCSDFCIQCAPDQCTQCDTTHYLYTKICVYPCPSNTFISNRSCIDCDASCLTCSGPNTTDCITCPPTKLLYFTTGWMCVSACPTDGYYSDGTTCQKCDASCLRCTAGANNNCTACNPLVHLYNNQCFGTCPSTTYTTGQLCADCNISCQTCAGGSNQECLSCKVNTYLLVTLAGKQCVSDCGPTLYENVANNLCSPCDTTCQECNGPNVDQCTKCIGSRYLQGTRCVTVCNNDSYKGANNMCVHCEASCTTCSAGTSSDCLSCTLPLYLNANNCVANCNSNQFKNDATASCNSCDITCLTCNGAGNKQCTSCPATFVLHVDNSCLDKCPVGYYADGTVCKKCPTECTTCVLSGSTPVCATCPPDQSLYNNTCVAICPPKTYKSNNGATNVCLICDASCQNCSGPSSTECQSCILPNYFSSDTFECKTTCKPKFYPSPTAQCLPCDPTCYQCTGSSANQCTACDGSLYLQNNTCQSTCAVGTFPNTINHKCDTCNSTCLNCSNSTATDCLTCLTPNFLQTGINSCLPSCKPSEFQNTTTQKCESCNISCGTCTGSGSDQCLTCKVGQYLYTIDPKRTCVTTCPDGFFIDGLVCTKCSDECLTCAAPGDNQSCLTCDSSKLLLDGKCVTSCPQKTYPTTSPTTKACSKCYLDCLTCTGSLSNECKTCQLPLYFVAATSECKATCDPKFYKNDAKAECSPCDITCATCSGPSQNQCLSCTGTKYLDGTVCVDTCSPQKFQNTANNTCGNCDSTCNTCNGVTDSNCLSCTLPNFFEPFTKKCVTNCKSNEYKDNASASCKPCHSTCATCNGSNNNQCTTCNGTDVLFNGSICKSDCPDGSYKDGLVCKTCNPACLTCIYPGDATKCVTCDPAKFLYNGQCLGACTNKTFSSILPDGTKICNDCDSTCQSCNGALSNNCTGCTLPNYLNPDFRCLTTCNVQFYKNGVTAICSPCNSDCFQCSGPNANQCIACQGTKFLENSQCQNTCSSKKYQNTNDNTCSPCHQSCKTCSGSLATNCTSCELPNFMQTGSQECKPTCNLNEYRDSTTLTCKACNITCKTCSDTGTNKCLSCNGTDLLYLGTICVNACPPGFYKDSNVCKQCSIECKTCDYPGDNTTCLSCQSDKFLINGSCQTQCSDKTFPVTSPSGNSCVACHVNCLTCTGALSNNCIKCNSPLYYNPVNNECQTSCDDKYYKNDLTSTCSPCDVSCQTCSGPNPTQCTGCSGTKYLDGTVCSDDCPLGKFKNQANNTCLVCHPTCKTCNGTIATNCITCAPLYYLQTSSQECKTTCNINEFRDNTQQICIICNKTCKTCSAAGIDKCLTCNGTDLLLDGKCINVCPDAYFQDGSVCKNCNVGCKRCIAPGDNKSCTACSSDKYLYNNECITSCPNKFFSQKILDTNICTSCDSSCDTCNGPNSNQCLTCKLPNYLNELTNECKTTCDQRYFQNDKFAICTQCNDSCFECTGSLTTQCKSCVGDKYLDGSSCVDKCSPGKFERASDNTCALCHLSCKTCNGTASTNCLSCQTPLYYQPLTNECSDTCYSSQFKNNSNATCINCNNSCKTCQGPNSNNCLSCKGSNLLHVDNTCISQCPDGFYQDGYTCKNCSTQCTTCSTSVNNCLSCSVDKYLYNGTCVTKCPPKTFIALVQGIKMCQLCDSSCLSCSGTANNQCKSCTLPNYLNNLTGQCTPNCNNGFYKNDKIAECSACEGSCFKCNGPAINSCTACIGNKYLDSQKCMVDCSIGKYKSPTDNVCLDCNSKCKTCNAQNPNNCESCQLPLYYQFRDKSCQLLCDTDQYRDDASVSCITCNNSCTTCLGNKDTDCITCSGSNYLENGKCVNTCQDGSFANKSTNRCEKCNRNCKTCYGPDIDNCLSCSLPLYYQRVGFKCVSHCDKKQYTNNQSITCEACHDDCATCIGALNNQCLTCSGSLNFYQNSCVTNCPDNYYPELNVCKICTEGCLICLSGAANKCQVCMDTYFLYQGKCLKKCPEFFFEDDYSNRCEPCSSNCSQCANYGSLTCIKCGIGYVLYNNACIPKCPIGTYVQNQTCINCNIACITCTGPSDNQCLSCQPNMYLQNNECVTQCDSNYAQIPNTFICMKCYNSCTTCNGPADNQCLTCEQDFIPFGTECLSECPDNFYKLPSQFSCSNCKQYCSKCTTDSDCQVCSKGYIMFNGECVSACPNQSYFVDASTNQCTLCNESCKDSGCYGTGDDQCIVSYIEAKESILFIIFMVKLGYWIFSCVSGYFMDRFDDNEYKSRVVNLMKNQQQTSAIIRGETENLSASNIEDIKRRNRNRFGENNQTIIDLNNNSALNHSQTLQNISLNTSSNYNQQIINQKMASNIISSQLQISPTKNQNSLSSWRLQTPEPANQSNFQTHRPIVVKRFSFKQDEGIATFREQDDSQKSIPQTTNPWTENNQQPIQLSYDQKLYYIMIGNDLIQIWTLYNPSLSRIFRTTLVYFKFLCFFYATELIYQKSTGLLILCLFLGMIIKEAIFILFIQFAICLRKGAFIAVFLLVIGIITHISVWFRPEIIQLTTNKDITWSWMYLTVFFADFVFIQSLLALARYMASVRHLERRRDKTQALLNRTFVDRGMLLKLNSSSQ